MEEVDKRVQYFEECTSNATSNKIKEIRKVASCIVSFAMAVLMSQIGAKHCLYPGEEKPSKFESLLNSLPALRDYCYNTVIKTRTNAGNFVVTKQERYLMSKGRNSEVPKYFLQNRAASILFANLAWNANAAGLIKLITSRTDKFDTS